MQLFIKALFITFFCVEMHMFDCMTFENRTTFDGNFFQFQKAFSTIFAFFIFLPINRMGTFPPSLSFLTTILWHITN